MTDVVLSRRQWLATTLALLGAAHWPVSPGGASVATVVEDWRSQPPGLRGAPDGWRRYETPGGRPAYDFRVLEDDGHCALDLRGRDDHSTIAKEVAVRLAETPVLEWAWKVVSFPAGADLRVRWTSDATGHLFVVWPRFPGLLRSRLIGYVWDEHLPVGTIVPSRKTGRVTFVVVRSGREAAGTWMTERRDVGADFATIFGEPAEDPPAIALSIDTDDTHSSAETLFGRIAFVGR